MGNKGGHKREPKLDRPLLMGYKPKVQSFFNKLRGKRARAAMKLADKFIGKANRRDDY